MTKLRLAARSAVVTTLTVTLLGCAQSQPVQQSVVTIPPGQPFPDVALIPEIAPIAAVPVKVEPQVITDFWTHLRRDMHLDLHLDQKRVQQEIAWFKRNPQYLHRLQPRLQTFLPYLYQQVQLRDFPAELALLPIVESALDLYAFSHGGAAGPWQFVRGTAKQYGLTIDEWFDGRRDIIGSTSAALAFLGDLHRQNDDWYIALAGYNAGQGNVNRAKRKNPDGNFFQLQLPRETKAYVPRLLALAAIIKEPESYGLTLPELENTIGFTTVATHSQFQIDKLIDLSGLSLDEFHRWNPGFSRWATSPRGPHHIVVPNHLDARALQTAIDSVPEKQRVDWQEVTIRSGDTLSGIALRHGTDVASLKQVNGLRNSRLRAGKKLLIPTAGKPISRPISGKATYVVQGGDSLWSIARAHNVNLRKLMITNQIGPKDPLPVGRKIVLPGVTGSASSSREVVRTVRYRVRSGDSLSRIATKFNVSVNQIVNWNKLDVRRYLQPGQGLVLHVNVMGGQ